MAPVWLAANLLLVTTAFKLSRRCFPSDDVFQHVIHVAVMCIACIVGVATLLGAVALLIPVVLVVSVAGIAVLVRTGLRGSGPRSLLPEAESERWWLGAWLVLVSMWIGHIAMEGLRKFPTDFDSLMYHMPLIVQWLQDRSLCASQIGRWSDPGNNELVGFWMVAPFSGEFLISLMNLPTAILLAVSTLELASRLGIPRSLAHLTAIVVVSHHEVLRQLVTAENDLAVVALFMAALWYGIRLLEQLRSRSSWSSVACPELLLGAVSLGLLTGVKWSSPGYTLVAGTTVVVILGVRKGWATSLRVAVLAVPVLFLFGGYWYVRNMLLTGSPLYPVGISESTDVLSQFYPNIWKSTFLGSGRVEVLSLASRAVCKFAGVVPFMAVWLAPFVVAWHAGHAFRLRWKVRESRLPDSTPGSLPLHHDTRSDVMRRLAVALLVPGTGLVLAVTPWTVEDQPGTLNHLRWGYTPARFGLCFTSMATLGLMWFLGDVAGWLGSARGAAGVKRIPQAAVGRGIVLVIVAGSVAHQYIWGQGWFTDYTVANVAGGIVCLWFVGLARTIAQANRQLRRIATAVCAVVAVGGSAAAAGYLSQAWHRGFVGHYDDHFSTHVFEKLARSNPMLVRIGVLDHRPYPFYGPGRSRSVSQPLWVASYEQLLEYVRASGVDMVVVRFVQEPNPSGTDRYQWCYGWIIEHPEHFVLLDRDGSFGLFAFRRGNRPEVFLENADRPVATERERGSEGRP